MGKKGYTGRSREHSLNRRGIKTASKHSMGKRQRFLKNTNQKRVYTGNVSEQILNHLLQYNLDYWRKHYVGYSGFHKEGDMWTAWDNSFGELSVENFWMKETARSWATELHSTASEMHRKDIKDAFKSIMDVNREEEKIFLRGTTSITDGTNEDIMKYLDEYKIEDLMPTDYDAIAYIIKANRYRESDFLRGTTSITDEITDDIAKKFKGDKSFQRSEYWEILKG